MGQTQVLPVLPLQASPAAEPGHGGDLPASHTLPPSVLSSGGIEQTVETDVFPLQAAAPVAETGHGSDLPPSPILPPKQKGKSYYCNICYVDTTRKNLAVRLSLCRLNCLLTQWNRREKSSTLWLVVPQSTRR